MSDIKKYHLSNKKLSIINDYGIYNYFSSNINNKMIARIADNNYVINIENDVNNIDIKPIVNKKEKDDCDIVSLGNELNIFCGKKLSNSQIDSLIEVLKELKNYYSETNINKQIFFIGGKYNNRFNVYSNCKEIDNIIYELEKDKSNIIDSNKVVNSMGFAKLWILSILTTIICLTIIIIGILVNL